MRSAKAPLFEQLKAHHSAGGASFHVPGHKSGTQGYGEAERYYKELLKIDVTEIPGLDDLHHPEEAIREAQELAAECFGAEQTFFLVGGSTSGNQAMILASCRRGDLLLVQRDAHKSVLHGLMLAGAKAVFLTPRSCEKTGLLLGVHPDDVKEALGRYPDAKGLLVTSPSYYGVGADLKPLANLLHEQGKLLLVDEAHGAHFGFHSALPGNALSAGADAVVQSTHKMLTAMTMGAMLHVQGMRIRREALRKSLAMLQSSSPSYPIMASLDISRRMMQGNGEALIEHGLRAVKHGISRIENHGRFRVIKPQKGIPHDTFKVLIHDPTAEMDGFLLKNALEERGCFAEMADPVNVLLVFSLSSTVPDADRLADALLDIDRIYNRTAVQGRREVELPVNDYLSWHEPVSEPVSFDLDSLLEDQPKEDKTYLPLASCVGSLAAEMIIPYPPGIPILHRGEVISTRAAAYLERLASLGSRFHGHDVTTHRTIPVLSVKSGPA